MAIGRCIMAVFSSRRYLFLASMMAMGYFLFDIVGNMVSTDLSNTLDPTTTLKGRYIIYVLVVAFAACLINRTKVLLQWEASPERVAATASSHSAVDMPSQEIQQLVALPESGDHSGTEVQSRSARVSEPPGRAGDHEHAEVGSQPLNDADFHAHIERAVGILSTLSAALTMTQRQAEVHSRSAPVSQEPSTVCQWAPPGGELRIRKICPTCPICGDTDCACDWSDDWIDDVRMEGVQFRIPRSWRQFP